MCKKISRDRLKTVHLHLPGAANVKNRNKQLAFKNLNQPFGLELNPKNRWVKKADTIPWDAIEERYAQLFPSNKGVPAKPLRMALGSLLLQKHLRCSDRELVEQITENPYFQYFIGLLGYQMEPPFVPSLLVEFRKRLTEEILGDINEMILEHNMPDDHDDHDDSGNSGTLILDATCAPQNIEYPQDIELLNQCREDLEGIVDDACYAYGLKKPRMYRKNARKDYLSLAKCRKRSGKKIRKAIKAQLQYVRRDLRYIDEIIAAGVILSARQTDRISVTRKEYLLTRSTGTERIWHTANREGSAFLDLHLGGQRRIRILTRRSNTKMRSTASKSKEPLALQRGHLG